MNQLITRYRLLLLSAIVLFSLALRLYKIDSPVADWHSWRQADTASVTRVFLNEGVDFLRPRYQDVSNIPSGSNNPQGYRMVEYPLYNLFHLFLVKAFPLLGVDTAGRLTSVIFSLISIVSLYGFVNLISGPFIGLLSALFLGVLPFSIFYSRVILPEPLMSALLLTSLYLFTYHHLQKRRSFLILSLSSLLLSLSLLVKPYAVFFLLPFLLMLFIDLKNKKLNVFHLAIFIIIAFVPLAFWRAWIKQFPEGIPASTWLYNLNGIRFRPAWFRWLFSNRLGFLILGGWGTPLFILGLIRSPKNHLEYSYPLLGIGILIYFSVFAGGNVTHDYYQAITLPYIAIFLSLGSAFIADLALKNIVNRALALVLVITMVVFMTAFSWYEIKGYYQINNPNIIKAGNFVDRVSPKEAKVIAPYNGDTAFLYQTNRFGWPAVTYDINQLIKEGASYYVSVNFDETTNQLLNDSRHQVIEKNNEFIVIKLNQQP